MKCPISLARPRTDIHRRMRRSGALSQKDLILGQKNESSLKQQTPVRAEPSESTPVCLSVHVKNSASRPFKYRRKIFGVEERWLLTAAGALRNGPINVLQSDSQSPPPPALEHPSGAEIYPLVTRTGRPQKHFFVLLCSPTTPGPPLGSSSGIGAAAPDFCVAAPPEPDRRPGPARRVPESAFRVARARRSGRRLVTAPAWSGQGAGIQRGPQRVRLGSWTSGGHGDDGPATGRLPPPGDLRRWGQAWATGPGLITIMPGVLHVAGLSGARGPHASSQGRSPSSSLLLRYSLPRARAIRVDQAVMPTSHCLTAAAAGNETQDAGQAQAWASSAGHCEPTMISI